MRCTPEHAKFFLLLCTLSLPTCNTPKKCFADEQMQSSAPKTLM